MQMVHQTTSHTGTVRTTVFGNIQSVQQIFDAIAQIFRSRIGTVLATPVALQDAFQIVAVAVNVRSNHPPRGRQAAGQFDNQRHQIFGFAAHAVAQQQCGRFSGEGFTGRSLVIVYDDTAAVQFRVDGLSLLYQTGFSKEAVRAEAEEGAAQSAFYGALDTDKTGRKHASKFD